MEDSLPLEPGKARIALNGDFSATELEEIIGDLAKVRSSMEPAVAMTAPMDGEALMQDEALFSMRTLANGGLRIWLRNTGFGWLVFTLTPANTLAIREFLSKKPGHTHTSH